MWLKPVSIAVATYSTTLFCFHLEQDGSLTYKTSIPLPGSPLDVAIANSNVVVSVFSPAQGPAETGKTLKFLEPAEGESWCLSSSKSVTGVQSEDREMDLKEAEKQLFTNESLRKMEMEDASMDTEQQEA